VWDGLDASAPSNSHNLLSVVDSCIPSIVCEPSKTGCNIREGQVVEQDHAVLGGIFGSYLGILEGVLAVVVSINEDQLPLAVLRLSNPESSETSISSAFAHTMTSGGTGHT
jgi:hypothetical protein